MEESKDNFLSPYEECILKFLRACPEAFASEMQIAWQAAGEGTFIKDPKWVQQTMPQLLKLRLVESDGNGRYRAIDHRSSTGGGRKFIAPHLREILEKSGRNMSAFSS